MPERARNMAGRTCPICGKVLRSGSEEAMSAHQRESQSCRPQANRSDSTSVKALEAKLAPIHESVDEAKADLEAQKASFGELRTMRSRARLALNDARRKCDRLRSEGKDYEVAEGDVMEFLFNV